MQPTRFGYLDINSAFSFNGENLTKISATSAKNENGDIININTRQFVDIELVNQKKKKNAASNRNSKETSEGDTGALEVPGVATNGPVVLSPEEQI